MNLEKDLCSCGLLSSEELKKNINNELSDELVGSVSDFFKVFSDKTRLRILTVLLKQELCVCDIASILDMSQSSISHQLRILRQFKIVKNRKEGKSVFYSLDDNHIENIIKQGIEHYEHTGNK